jgi:hypothetical protein
MVYGLWRQQIRTSSFVLVMSYTLFCPARAIRYMLRVLRDAVVIVSFPPGRAG